MKNKCGIYKITNITNGKKYIGSAVNIGYRFKTHKQLLKNNKHFNTHLQSSYNKHGVESFKYEIIELVGKEILLEKETFWISYLNTNDRNYGYNKRLIVSSNLGIKLSEETRRKLSESHIGHKRSEETHKKIIESQYKSVCQFDKNGNFIKKYNSLKEAAESLGFKYTTSITACLKGKLPSALGFIWKYSDKEKQPIEDRFNNKNVKIKITCLLTKKITIFESIKECCDILKISRATIFRRLKSKNYKNLLWEKM